MFYNELYVGLCNDVEEMSNGRFAITVSPPGALCPDVEILKSVAAGMIEMGLSSMPYHKGFMPEGEVGLMPWGLRTYEDILLAYYEYGLRDFFKESYANNGVHLLDCQFNRGVIIVSTKPIDSAADYEGMLIRTHGTVAAFVEGLGASTVYIPGGEVYSALATGTVDACTWGSESTIRDFGWYEQAKYFIYPLAISVMLGYDIYVNPDDWDALPPDLQAILAKCVSDTMVRKGYYRDVYDSMLAWQEMEAAGAIRCDIAEKDYPTLMKSAEGVWDTIAAKGPRTKLGVKIVTDYLRSKGYTDYKID